MGVGGCFFEHLYDYLKDRKQYVRVKNITSKTLKVISGVTQGSLLEPLFFCVFINNLPEMLKFSSSFIISDDLKTLATAKTPEVYEEMLAIERSVKSNKIELAVKKCAQIIPSGSQAGRREN